MAGPARARGRPHLVVEPATAPLDAPVSIRLVGVAPQQPVTMRARLRDELGRLWTSRATFMADGRGRVDVGAQPPVDGTYGAPDPMGLFWSMLPAAGAEEGPPFVKRTAAPLRLTLTAEVAGRPAAEATLERYVLPPGGVRTVVRDGGLVATLFHPAGPGPSPAVIFLGGSEGGLQEARAALFAAHGYAALALAYFGLEHLPPELVEIPLEYVETAIRWLLAQPAVASDRLAVVGGSKGGELALLVGATCPQVAAVVGYVASPVVFGGIGRGLDEPARSSWAYRGRPLAYVARRPLRLLEEQLRRDEAVALLPLYAGGLADAAAVARATIPVERIRGPVLLISGGDDQFWPSTRLAELALQRLAAHRHPYPSRHLHYAGAGHLIGLPFLPTTVARARHPLRGFIVRAGGNARDDAVARADSWPKVLAFLDEHLKRPSGRPA